MRKFITSILIILALFIFVACSADQTEPVEATRPSATAVVAEPTALPTQTAEPTAETAATEPASNDDLAAFIEQLQTAVTNQNYADLEAAMSDAIAVGAWRSEWRTYNPEQLFAAFRAASLPAPLSVQFTSFSTDDLANFLGQPPASMFGPTVNVVAALHSTGWGQSTSDEAILFVTEEDGRFVWSGFLYHNARFADAALDTVAAPVGLIYTIINDGLFQIQLDGQPRQLLNTQERNIPNILIAPDGAHAAYTNEQQQVWIMDTATGEQQQFAADFTASDYLQWGDKDTLFVGIWLDPNEAEGPNNGHIAILDIASGDLQILDEEHFSGSRPALLSDYDWVAFDVFPGSQDDILTGRHYHPDSGVRIFDQTTFEGNSGNPIFNPGWSPDPNKIAWLTYIDERHMVQVFDVEAKTAVTLFDWDPARFGALVPSPIWSPDGRWLVLEVWANGPEGSGIWLLAADGSSQTLVDADGHDPYWVNADLLVFNINNSPRLYDVASEMAFKMDLPENSWVFGVTNEDDLLVQSGVIRVAETSTQYVLAQQDVTIYSGPGEDYEVVGSIFDGQTALVTGAGFDNDWWRVICPDDTVGNCWVTGDTAFVTPVDSATAQTGLPDLADLEVTTTTLASPDGRWQATLSQSEPVMGAEGEQFFTSLTVADGTTSWQPLAEWRAYGLGYASPAIYRWSADGRYLYYNNKSVFDGCALFNNANDLYRLDITDGSTSIVLDSGLTSNLALSPDETMVAYTQFNGQGIVAFTHNVAGGNDSSVAVAEGSDVQAGNIVWSPDSTQFLLTVAHAPCNADWTHSIVRVNAANLTAVTLIEEDARQFTTLEWTDETTVWLQDKDGNAWLLDVASGDLTAE